VQRQNPQLCVDLRVAGESDSKTLLDFKGGISYNCYINAGASENPSDIKHHHTI
jgi:hypothetical protein